VPKAYPRGCKHSVKQGLGPLPANVQARNLFETLVPRCLLILVLLALGAPAAAWAEDATITSRDVPLHGARALQSSAPDRFSLVGLHWQGSGSVQFRTRSLGGRWSAWRAAQPEDDGPDRGSPERRLGSWRLGSPWWVGPSDGIRYRVRGDVRRLRAWFVWSPVVQVPERRLSIAGSPQLVTRSAWRADERIVRSKPVYADRLSFAVVHHTAGRNGYSAGESASIVRSIQLYHVKGNGWNDIGYNLLVDRFGKVFEGRGGGVDRNVVGAHAEGFNTSSVGVAVLGEYSSSMVPKAAEDALARVLAWRLDLGHVDPLGTLSHLSGGNARFPGGLPVFLRTVSGHRDTGFTACPGNALYAKLGAIAGAAQRTGLPKLYEPRVTGAVGRSVRFRARLSSALPWRVSVTDAEGLEVAARDGFGTTVDWTWASTGVRPGSYVWAIEAGPDVLPARGTFGPAGPAAPLSVSDMSVQPESISPNGDGQADEATLTYTLTAPATVSISILDSVGSDLGFLQRPVRKAAGQHTARFTGAAVADGTYQLFLKAVSDGGDEVTATANVLVSRTLGAFAITPAAFSPNADGRVDRLRVSFTLSSPAAVRVRVLREGKYVTTLANSQLGPGPQRLDWDGSKRIGRLPDGTYEAVVEATDAIGLSSLRLPFVSDTRAPQVRVLKGRPLRVWVSEPALLTLRVNGVPLREEARRAGELRVQWVGAAGRVRVVAWDAAGNVSRPAVRR
jgi:N-acetylmuramoyl-L-alanine amidase